MAPSSGEQIGLLPALTEAGWERRNLGPAFLAEQQRGR
jgi:hypothetical protein